MPSVFKQSCYPEGVPEGWDQEAALAPALLWFEGEERGRVLMTSIKIEND